MAVLRPKSRERYGLREKEREGEERYAKRTVPHFGMASVMFGGGLRGNVGQKKGRNKQNLQYASN